MRPPDHDAQPHAPGDAQRHEQRDTQHPTVGSRLSAATAGLPAPLVVVDTDALDANAADLVRRARGVPVRVASRSVRVRWVLDRVLARPGFAGVMAYSLREPLWLVSHGVRDVLVGYPTVDTGALVRPAPRRRAASSCSCASTSMPRSGWVPVGSRCT